MEYLARNLLIKRQRQFHSNIKDYYKGKFHEIVKEEKEVVVEDSLVKRDQLRKKKKEFSMKVKK